MWTSDDHDWSVLQWPHLSLSPLLLFFGWKGEQFENLWVFVTLWRGSPDTQFKKVLGWGSAGGGGRGGGGEEVREIRGRKDSSGMRETECSEERMIRGTLTQKGKNSLWNQWLPAPLKRSGSLGWGPRPGPFGVGRFHFLFLCVCWGWMGEGWASCPGCPSRSVCRKIGSLYELEVYCSSCVICRC